MFRALLPCALLLTATCTNAAGVGIHTMIAGNQAVELEWTRQLTSSNDGQVACAAISPDGKYIAYVAWPNGLVNLYVIKSTGGRPILVLSSAAEHARSGELVSWQPSTRIVWSPDSKSFAVEALMKHPSDAADRPKDSPLIENVILVYSTSGALRSSFTVGKQTVILSLPIVMAGTMVFSPDSRKLAAEGGGLTIYDIATGEATRVSTPGRRAWLHDWRDAASVLCLVQEERFGTPALVRLPLNGDKPETLVKEYSSHCSPDLRFRIVPDKQGITVEDLQTGKKIEPLPVQQKDVLKWMPNSRMFMYCQQEEISDGGKRRTRKLSTLWLAAPTQGKLNTLCVALDAAGASWSANCTRAAYVSAGRLYSLDLSVRAPSAEEKTAAGLVPEQ